VIHATSQAYGATAEIDYIEGYPTVVNEPGATAFAAEVAAELVGGDSRSMAMPPPHHRCVPGEAWLQAMAGVGDSACQPL
jgi:metal-dependent amidase/aminoacylase/carboxypeptidase family protein